MTSKWLKFIAIILCCCLAIGFSGCDGDEDLSSGSSSNEEEEVKIIKVGYIFHGGADEGGFTGQINEQRKSAAKYCSGKIDTYYIDHVAVADFESAVKALYSYGCEVIVSCSSVYTNSLSSIAGRYMNIDFINYGAISMGTANVTSYVETYYQGAYIGGVLAAYNSVTEKIGIVADDDMHGIYPVVNAATLGMQRVFKNAEMYVAGATKDNEIEQAIDALIERGCDVIMCYTESKHSADYCEKRGVKFIGGLDYSLSEEDYSRMIMYFYSKRDSFFLKRFKELQYDEWDRLPYMGTMANGIINISEALPCAKDESQKLIDYIAPLVASGQLYIFSGELKDTNGKVRYMQKDILSENEIYALNWYVQGVNVIGNYRQPHDSAENKFEVKS
ncbi:MAG: BMP family ABC transporter substrate-binding protein [Oscillospiraceae bacterium]|nr:BMP family ABC transporter substrate-binding protein [Oscillospiraceae bacterium]